MSHEVSPSLAWLSEILPVIGPQIDIVVEAQPDDARFSGFEYGDRLPVAHAIPLDVRDGESGAWRDALGSTLKAHSWAACLVNLLTVPMRSVRTDVDGEVFHDSAAFLAEALRSTPDRAVVVALAPASLLLDLGAASLRAWLATNQIVEWIIFLGSEANILMGAHPFFVAVLLVIRQGDSTGRTPNLLRFVNLSDCSRSDWTKVISDCTKRAGGEVGSSIVLRDPALDGSPWTYQRFSKAFASKRQDAEHLGTLRPLCDFVEDIRPGLRRTVDLHRFRELDDNGVPPEGSITCYGGRSIERGGRLGFAVCAVLPENLSPDLLLKRGDVLVRSIVGLQPGSPLVLAATVTEDASPATFDRSCIRIRWNPGLRSHVTDLLSEYLNSTHARDWLIAHGVKTTLSTKTLGELEVPDPSEEVLAALEVLAEAEQQYQSWAEQVANARRGIFASTSVKEQVLHLLRRQRTELERLQAARDAGSYQHQIRNYFPHPIALRRESIVQEIPGMTKIDAVVDCAEHLISLLAVLAIMQERTSDNKDQRVTATLMSFARQASLHLDWGKCVALLREGAELTARHANPLTLPFPDLGELQPLMHNQSSKWSIAEGRLREWRNKQSHLQRLPEPELQELCEDFVNLLDDLLQSVSFLSSLPLVQVMDYELSPVTQERKATLQMLQGISTAFERKRQKVPEELPRGAVGFLTRRGTFLSASPWLLMEACPTCKRPEIFIFSRYEGGQPTYVAMETGHAHKNQAMAPAIAALLGRKS